MTENILQFPKHKIVREVAPNEDETEKLKEKGRQNYAEEIVADFVVNILNAFDNYGIDTDNKSFDKDLSFSVDAMRAMIYRCLRLDHHLHDFIDQSVTVMKRNNEGNLILEPPSDNDTGIILPEINRENLDKED